ncbi:secreted protein [Melampsora americana]|nr:secreted protein [Melampsora americana]
MNLIILVFLSIILQIFLARSDEVLRYRLPGNSQTCIFPSDGNNATNLYQCPNVGGPVDLNDCLVAGKIMHKNDWSSAGYRTCGVLYWKRDATGEPELIVPGQENLNISVVVNSLNEFAWRCCHEVTPPTLLPVIESLPLDSRGPTSYVSGLVTHADYSEARELVDEDIEILIEENKKDIIFPEPSNKTSVLGLQQ